MRTPAIVTVVLLTWLAQARAEGSPDDADADGDADADAVAAAPPTITTKAKAKDKVKDKVKANGRVFVRETLSDDLGSWDAQAKIDSARLGLRYHHEQLKARVEVELRSSSKRRAAF